MTDIKGVVSNVHTVHWVSRLFLLSEQKDAGNDYFEWAGCFWVMGCISAPFAGLEEVAPYESRCFEKCLASWHLRCCAQTRNTGITWALVTNAESQAPSQTLIAFPGNSAPLKFERHLFTTLRTFQNVTVPEIRRCKLFSPQWMAGIVLH